MERSVCRRNSRRINTGRAGNLRATAERFEAARRSTPAKTAEILDRAPSTLSGRALLLRQRVARKTIAEALARRHGAPGAQEIAFHLVEWFEEAAFLVALQLEPKRYSKVEIEVGVSDLLAHALDHLWEAGRVAGTPLPCL